MGFLATLRYNRNKNTHKNATLKTRYSKPKVAAPKRKLTREAVKFVKAEERRTNNISSLNLLRGLDTLRNHYYEIKSKIQSINDGWEVINLIRNSNEDFTNRLAQPNCYDLESNTILYNEFAYKYINEKPTDYGNKIEDEFLDKFEESKAIYDTFTKENLKLKKTLTYNPTNFGDEIIVNCKSDFEVFDEENNLVGYVELKSRTAGFKKYNSILNVDVAQTSMYSLNSNFNMRCWIIQVFSENNLAITELSPNDMYNSISQVKNNLIYVSNVIRYGNNKIDQNVERLLYDNILHEEETKKKFDSHTKIDEITNQGEKFDYGSEILNSCFNNRHFYFGKCDNKLCNYHKYGECGFSQFF